MGDWQHYVFTQAQLKQYLGAFTGENVNVVNRPNGGSTHVPTKNVSLEVGTAYAQDIAAHEGLHVLHTEPETIKQLHSDADRTIFNVIEDACMERWSFRDRPGLRVQFQEKRIDTIMPLILGEAWLSQALKGIILLTVGYDFPREAFKPKARKLLIAFEKSGLMWDIRNAATSSELLPLIPRVLALFDEPIPQSRKPETEPERPSPPKPEGHNSDGADGDCTHCDDLDRQERGGLSMDRTPDADKEQGEPSDGESTAGESGEDGEEPATAGERAARTYDVDEAEAEAEAEARLNDDKTGPSGPAPFVRGKDTATGGPTVNRLMANAKKAKRDLESLDIRANEKSRKEAHEAVDNGSSIISAEHARDGSATSATNLDMPKGAEPVAGDKVFGSSELNLTTLFSKEASGALGYAGRQPRVVDSRHSYYPDPAIDASHQLAGITNFLGRQLQVFLQSQDRTGLRMNERHGMLDARRAYQMGGARFDVYKYPPNPNPAKPLVVLTTDMSSSMAWGVGQPRGDNSPAFHAMLATIVVGGALRRIGIPFEAHGFSTTGLHVFKTFDQSWNNKSIGALSNIVNLNGGGTPAAEGLALAWARALTRPETRRIIIQVTDGSVASNTRKMAEAITIDGGTVIGVGIGVDNISDYYKDSLSVRQSSELPGAFARLLKRLALTGKLR